MTDKLNPKQPLSVEESVLATMWAMEAIVELLQSKGLCSKQEVHDMVSELRTRHAELKGKVIVPGTLANTTEEQYLIDHVLNLIEAVGLQPAESKELLRRVSLIIDQHTRTKQMPR